MDIKETIPTRLLSLPEASTYIGLGRSRGRTFLDKIGATRRIGKRVLFDKVVIDRYLDSTTEQGDEHEDANH